jgi:hypothetical protein
MITSASGDELNVTVKNLANLAVELGVRLTG